MVKGMAYVLTIWHFQISHWYVFLKDTILSVLSNFLEEGLAFRCGLFLCSGFSITLYLNRNYQCLLTCSHYDGDSIFIMSVVLMRFKVFYAENAPSYWFFIQTVQLLLAFVVYWDNCSVFCVLRDVFTPGQEACWDFLERSGWSDFEGYCFNFS